MRALLALMVQFTPCPGGLAALQKFIEWRTLPQGSSVLPLSLSTLVLFIQKKDGSL